MFVPYGTDAPIYHWPVMTVILIVVNTALLPFSGYLTEEGYALMLGDDLHPLQWVTHNFLHGGLLHLVGNMIFLWAYGIIVEGKLGWWGMLLVYLAIGTAHGALVQTICLGLEEPFPALGASAAIFGLLGLCVVWAPSNCLNCFYFFVMMRIFTGTWEAPIYVFGILQVLLQGWDMFMDGLTGAGLVGSALGHLSGFGWGFLFGIMILKAGLVDCEGWDLFALMGKRFTKGSGLDGPRKKTPKYLKAKRPSKQSVAVEDVPPEDRASSALDRIRKRLDQGETRAALDLYAKSAPSWKAWGWSMPEADLMRLIKAGMAEGYEADSIPLMFEFARLYPQKADRIRLKLAQILIEKQERPARALRLLDQMATGELPPDLQKARRRLLAKAEAMIEEGVLELETDD
ncbi:MAG: rhomboid family intramembrane serine protease [Isosphaeraceae bacterium]